MQRNGDRDSVSNVLILVTDGRSSNPQQTIAMAKQIHSAGIETLAVGVGTQLGINELKAIASDSKHVFHVKTFDALQTLQAELRNSTCTGNFFLPSTVIAIL